MNVNYKKILIIFSVVIFLVGIGSLFFIHKRATERINQINNQSYTLPELVGPNLKDLRSNQKNGTCRFDGMVYPEHGRIFIYCSFKLAQKSLSIFGNYIDIPLVKTDQKNKAQIVITTDNVMKNLTDVGISKVSSSFIARQAYIKVNLKEIAKEKDNLLVQTLSGIGSALGLPYNHNRRSLMYEYDDYKGTPKLTNGEFTQLYDDYSDIIFAK